MCVYCHTCLSRGYANFSHMLPLLDTLRTGLRCSWGMRQTQKGIITFLPKHRNSMNYLRSTRRAPRQLRDWTTQDSVREPWDQGPAEEPGGISGDPEVTSKGKLNDKKTKGGAGSGEWSAHSYTYLSNVCMFMHAFTTDITHTHVQINSHRNTHVQDPHHWFAQVYCKHT